MNIPTILNIGCGSAIIDNALNTDINPKINPDAILDITKISFGEKIYSKTFGEIEIKEEMFDKICALDVLEHISDLVTTMWNCYKLLKFNGMMMIQVPYDLSYGAWRDPTHVRGFNEFSWSYWTMPWCLQQFGWKEGFTLRNDSIKYGINNDNNIIKNIESKENRLLSIEEALLIPRAVDGMQVILYKPKKI